MFSCMSLNSTASIFFWASGGTVGAGPNDQPGYGTVSSLLFIYTYCDGPGGQACPIMPPGGDEDGKPAINYGKNEILSGNLNGSAVVEGYNVEWTATDATAATCQIVAWRPSEEKPEPLPEW